ncbi:MAG: M56 family metallopeptidase [Firmicutes bacterium]|nr:M56 family metallopeptidase [Bacillota bacterium]
MLDDLFLSVLNMSFFASYVIVLVLLARLALKKAPKIFSYALWGVVLLRLLCPLSFESALSLIPIDKQPIPQDIIYSQAPQISTGMVAVDNIINPILPVPTDIGASINPIQVWLFVGEIVWILGIVVMAAYSVISYAKLKGSLATSTPVKDNIYLADYISTPFVLGMIRPKIYIPSSLLEDEQGYIICHELCHIKRLDHITRMLGFLALSVHWFNPLVWIAFVLSGKDMELSCDEAVMKSMDTDIKAEYSQSLLRFSTTKKMIHATPLAFGEGDTKSRIKNVLNYKKPKFWMVLITALICVVAVFCLVSNPQSKVPLTLYAYSENGVIPMNLGTYSWNGVVVDAISYIEMEYENEISYNENRGHRNANIFFSTSNTPSDFNSDNARGTKDFKVVEMKRYVNGKEEILEDFGDNMIQVSLEQDASYLYVFKVQFGENHAYYSIKINNNVKESSEPFISKVVNGTVSATITNKDLTEEIVMNSLLVSAAWEGIDINSLDNYYHIHYLISEDSTGKDYYAFLLDGKPVLQFGNNERYIILGDELYNKLESSFTPLTHDQAVIEALSDASNRYLGDECFGEGHIILGTEKDGDTTKIYTLTMVGYYGFVNNNFEKASGTGVIPAVVTLKNNKDVTIEYPKDGSYYASSIKEMFPLKYHSRIFGGNDSDRKNLKEQERVYAKEYLSKLGRKADIGDYGDFEHILLTDLGVSVEVSNGLEDFYKVHSYYPYFIGTKEIIENSVRMVYEMSYDESQKEIKFTKYTYDTKEVVEQFVFNSITGGKIAQ